MKDLIFVIIGIVVIITAISIGTGNYTVIDLVSSFVSDVASATINGKAS